MSPLVQICTNGKTNFRSIIPDMADEPLVVVAGTEFQRQLAQAAITLAAEIERETAAAGYASVNGVYHLKVQADHIEMSYERFHGMIVYTQKPVYSSH